jgi:hypothetical protein
MSTDLLISPGATPAGFQAHRAASHSDRIATALAIAAFAVCSLAAAVRSAGFLEADGCTHYLFARHAFEQPEYFVDVWGRPLCTALFALPAKFAAVFGVRCVSLIMAIGCGLIARAIARGQQYRWPALALIFTLGQPLVFLHSFAELTELPFALVLGAALLAYQRKRWGWMAALVAIAPLGRPEGFALLLPAAIALAFHRQWKWILLLPLGLIGWSLAGQAIAPTPNQPWWRWLFDHWPYGGQSVYTAGSPLHFIALLPMVVGPFALPAMWTGVGLAADSAAHWTRDHRVKVECLIAALPLGVLIGHSFLYWRGLMASNGEARYLLVAAPMWGLLCARGWEWIFIRQNWKKPIAWAALAVVLPGLVNYYWRVVPLSESGDWSAARQVAQWYESSAIRPNFPRILCNHPAVFYFLDQNPLDKKRSAAWLGENIDHPPAGVVLVWDPIYSIYNANPRAVMTLERVTKAGWVRDRRAELKSAVNDLLPADAFPRQWHIFRSPLDAAGNPTPSETAHEGNLRCQQMPLTVVQN